MANYKARGTSSHCVIYWYKAPDGTKKQKWETYKTKLEATLRKAHIQHLEDEKLTEDLYAAVLEYDESRNQEKDKTRPKKQMPEVIRSYYTDNMSKTMDELFMSGCLSMLQIKNYHPTHTIVIGVIGITIYVHILVVES